MAIDNTLFCRPTESIVLPTKRKFFPTDIPIPHPQLRHFISTTERDWIYYATEYDIYCFHVPTQRKRLLITLPFTPRCLSAGLGWICAGGENNGDCAFIRLRRRQHSQMDVDSSLPLDSNTLNSTPPVVEGETGIFPDLRPELILEQLGGLIVNSITIQELPQEDPNEAPEPVAVISNNDKSVKVFSLLRRRLLTELKHNNCMNYAMISPDSGLLVGVGDENKAYFYRRELNRAQVGFFDGKKISNYHWNLLASPTLPSDGNAVDDCCFSAAFSPSGHLCAVAAQNGMITVFDIQVLNNLGEFDMAEDSILCTFRSSRPRGVVTGAVRAMAFSPGPWDLLLWAEEYGRAGLADVRQTFARRQIIKLETHAADMERITLEDLTDPQLKELDPETRMIHQFRDTVALDDEDPESRQQWLRSGLTRRRSSQLSFAEAREHLNEQERHLVDSMRTNPAGSESAFLDSLLPPRGPYSVNYTSSPRVRASLSQGHEPARSRNARLAAMMNQFMRNMDPDTPGDRHQPRRRSSVVLSQRSEASERSTIPSDSTLRVSTSPSRMPQAEADGSQDQSVPTAPEGEPENMQSLGNAISRDLEVIATLQRHISGLPGMVQRPDLPDLERRIAEQQRLLEQLQREMNARINSSPHLSATRRSDQEDDSGSSLHSWRDIARSEIAQALEPFDPTGIAPENLAAERERYDQRANAAADYARRLRHVLFADHSTAQSSALPTTNLTSLTQTTAEHQQSHNTSNSDTQTTPTQENQRSSSALPSSERDNTPSRRPSTPSNPQANRERSLSPTSRALALARLTSSATASRISSSTNPTSYSEAADARRRQESNTSVTSSLRSRPAVPFTRHIALSDSIRQARIMSMQNAAARMTDANGNWMAGEAWGMSIHRSSATGNSSGESWSERGVGTAGLGWSQDGKHFYIGTEEGIFEYTINLGDRMTFPDFSFR